METTKKAEIGELQQQAPAAANATKSEADIPILFTIWRREVGMGGAGGGWEGGLGEGVGFTAV